jgi:hypothetical protein
MLLIHRLLRRVGVGILGAIFLGFIVTMIFKGRNLRGLPNTIRGEVLKVSGLSNEVDPYVVVSSMTEMCHRTEFKIHPGETCVYNERFTWSVSANDLEKFKQVGKVRFEVFNMKGTTYALTDSSLGAVEVPIPELYVEGQVERMEALRLRTKKGIVVSVKIGIYAEHFFFQSFNRFLQSWKLRQREVSFWTRVVSIGLSVGAILVGLYYLHESEYKSLGITDIVVGSIVGGTILPHVMHWLGVTILDVVKMDSLGACMSLYMTCATSMFAIWKWIGPSDPLNCIAHFLLIAALLLGAILFFVGDLRGEPGSSCIGRTLGGMCSCCTGSRAALIRQAL